MHTFFIALAGLVASVAARSATEPLLARYAAGGSDLLDKRHQGRLMGCPAGQLLCHTPSSGQCGCNQYARSGQNTCRDPRSGSNVGRGVCEPEGCKLECNYGMVQNKDDCKCQGDWILADCKTYCTPDCGDHGAFSLSKGKCECDRGYKADGYTCIPDCPNGSITKPNGKCVCPSGTELCTDTNTCIPVCTDHKKYNPRTGTCSDCEEPYIRVGDKCKPCSEGTEYCSESHTCVSICKHHSAYNPLTHKCDKCEDGYVLQDGQCEPCRGRFEFDPVTKTCKCPAPNVLNEEGECKPCRGNFEYDPLTKTCKCPAPNVLNEEGECKPCRGNTEYDPITKSCQCPAPYVLKPNGECKPCRGNFEYDPLTKTCACPAPNVINEEGECKPCRGRFEYDPVTKSCQCQAPFVLQDGECKKCKGDLEYDPLTKTCKCPLGTFPGDGNTCHMSPSGTTNSKRNNHGKRDAQGSLIYSAAFHSRNMDSKFCPDGLSACPIGSSLEGGYECVNTMDELENCGGCSSIGEGQDCTALVGAAGVGCNNGTCVVFSCTAGHRLSARGSCEPLIFQQYSHSRRHNKRVQH